MPVASPIGRRAQFLAPAATSVEDEMARRREAFVAAERARAGNAVEADPIASAERAKQAGLPSFAGRKSLAAAYSFWFLLWVISAHRFYLGRWATGIAQTCLWYVSLMFWMAGHALAFYPMVTGLAWVIADLVLIPGMRRATNERLEAKFEAQLYETPKAEPAQASDSTDG